MREWIDTLLMAAVIAKDKRQQAPAADTPAADSTPAPAPPQAAEETAEKEAATVEDPAASIQGENKALPPVEPLAVKSESPRAATTTAAPADAEVMTTAAAAAEEVTPVDPVEENKSALQAEYESGGVKRAGDALCRTDEDDDGGDDDDVAQRGSVSVGVGEQQPVAVTSEAELDDSDAIDAKRYRRRRCEVPGCTKFARFNNACSGHGGRRLCSHAGCARVAQFGHKCSAHGGIKYCRVEGCSRAVQSRGCCKTHGGGVRCQTPGCDKGAISKGHCRAHGGGSRCAELGCQKWAQRHGFCVRHSKSDDGSALHDLDAHRISHLGGSDVMDIG